MKATILTFSLVVALFIQGASAAMIIVTTTDNSSGPGDGLTSLYEAIQTAGAGDTIQFLIPGLGPHVIQTPLGGYPLITVSDLTIDGYSQPGAFPNTNSILGGNNAQIQIVLDSTGADSGVSDPRDPALNSRRSTRMVWSDFPNPPNNTGFGSSENAMLGIYQADNVTIRGLSFIARPTPGSDTDPSIYAVALAREALNARVQGCWFGLAPGGASLVDVKPPASAVASFQWRAGGDVFSGGSTIGTDGDGFGDRGEFNIIIGGRIGMAIEAPDLKVAGNYVNVFPNGLTFLDTDASYQLWVDVFQAGGSDPGDVTVENLGNGRVAHNTTIGTNGDGVSDADERNIFNHAIYDHEIEIYNSGTNLVIAGNYFGVGVNGTALAPVSTNAQPDFVELPGTSSIRVGSNGDGVSDDLEGNLIVNGPGDVFVVASSTVPIVARRNQMRNNNYLGIPFAEGQSEGTYAGYYSTVVADSSMVVPVLRAFTNNILAGSMIGPNGADYISAFIDVYEVDPAALAKTHNWPSPITHPLRWLASFTDNGAGDLDAAANQFAVDLTSFGLADTNYLTVAVTYSRDAASSNTGRAVTSPASNPISRRPALILHGPPNPTAVVSWLAYQGAYHVQHRELLDSGPWQDFTNFTYTAGRNISEVDVDPFHVSQFFRLISQ